MQTRDDEINSWEDVEFRQAEEATGRKKRGSLDALGFLVHLGVIPAPAEA